MTTIYQFCPRCATPLDDHKEGDSPRRRCARCGFIHYNNPVPAAGGIIQRDSAVCLVRRAFEPRKGYWSLPAGFMEYAESARQCAEREVAEETGLRAHAGDVLGVYSGFDDPRQHAVLIVYWMDEPELREPIPGDDAEEVIFFRVEDIPEKIAFRAHREALRDAFVHSRFRQKPH
jgi:ADP-ribose pyrophosphatase YjhB (NUDIX family)